MKSWRSRKRPSELSQLAVPLVAIEGGQQPRESTAGQAEGSYDPLDVEPKVQVTSSEAYSDLEQRFLAWCQCMGFTKALLMKYEVHEETLRALFERDTMVFARVRSHWFRPRSIEYMPERLWLALIMRPAWVSASLSDKKCWDPRDWIWMQGVAIPMVNTHGYALKLLMSNCWRGGEAGFKLTLHSILLISMGIQLRKVLEERPDEIATTLHNGDSETWKWLIYHATGTSARLFWPLLFAPTVLMGISQMIFQTTRTLTRGRDRLLQMAKDLLRRLETPSIWGSWMRPLLPLDQPSFQLRSLADQLTFDGRPRLEPDHRLRITRYLTAASQQTRGLHRLLALKLLTELSIGTHIDNLRHYRQERFTFTAETPLSHLVVRMEATRTLHAFIHARPSSLPERLYHEWARYQGWMVGQSTHRLRVAAYILMRLGLTAYFFYGFKVIIDAIMAYLDCPEKTGIGMTGVASWSNDYTQPCFDAYIEFFRQLPGQPVSFLVDIIERVHFTEKNIDLNLAHKGVNATEIVMIVDALAGQGVGVSTLDLTGNVIARAQDYNTLMPVLVRTPSLRTLILNDVGLETSVIVGANTSGSIALAHWLPRLTHLSRLSIRGHHIGFGHTEGAEAIAAAFAQCTQLRSFTLIGRNIGSLSSTTTITLASALPHLKQLTHFELSSVYMVTETAQVLAENLPKVTQLQQLIMRDLLNFASPEVTTQWLNAISYMPSLSELDLTGSVLGFLPTSRTPAGRGPLMGLTNVTRRLSSLSVLRLNRTLLAGHGGGFAFAEALESRPAPLRVLELEGNNFSRSSSEVIGDVLKRWHLPSLPAHFRTANETRVFLAGLAPSQSRLIFEDGPQNDESLRALFQGIAQSHIIDLQLNGLSFTPSAWAYEPLANCSQLQVLSITQTILNHDVSNAVIMSWFSLLDSLAHLEHLTDLSLPRSFVWFHDAVGIALNRTLGHLQHLEAFDLSGSYFAYSDQLLPVLDTLASLPSLKKLRLASNYFGLAGTNAPQALFKRLPHFHALQSLDVSDNAMGHQAMTVRLLTEFLSHREQFFNLNATGTQLGRHPEVARDLMIVIANNPHVRISLTDAGFGSQQWPPALARFASETYDPYLQAACSNLQCFGIQPTLPDLGNSTRINDRERQGSSLPSPPTLSVALVATVLIALCLGLGLLLIGFKRIRSRRLERMGSLLVSWKDSDAARSQLFKSSTPTQADAESSQREAPLSCRPASQARARSVALLP